MMRMSNQLEQIKKELKRVASVKCRLNKQKGKKSYEEDMRKVLEEEEQLKALRDSLVQPKKTVTNFTYEDVQQLSYEEVLKAIKSIQSKKSNTKWLTPIEGDNDAFRNACRIEDMLNERKSELQPTAMSIKSKLEALISNSVDMSKEELVEQLKSIIE
jgi:hypothetical protein